MKQHPVMPWKHLQTLGLMPLGAFVSTYSSDYKPLKERHPQLNQLKPRTEARAAPAFINPPQADRETWPIFHQYFYKTTNSTYGSQPPSSCLFPASVLPFAILAPSVSEASIGVVGPALTGARAQEVRVARETGPLLGKEEKGQLRYVFGGKANVWEQQEAKDESQPKTDVLYEEGMFVLSSHIGPACCEDFLRSVCREAGLQHFPHLPVASSPIITLRDAENWGNSAYLGGLRSAVGLNNSTFLQPTSRQCSCCAWETDYPDSWCFKMQSSPPDVPRGSTVPLARVQPSVHRTEPSRKPLLTEYQASYTAEWAQPKVQQRDSHHRHPSRHQILYLSL